jgi:uncharacterized membrane protein HdeD (DUF308 family)
MSPVVIMTTDEVDAGDELAKELEHAWGWFLVAGIIAVLLGFVVLSWRTQTLYVLTYFAGAVFLFIGLVRLVDVFLVPAHRWISLLGALIFVAIGLIIVVWPHITLFVVALLIALGFLLGGVLELVKAFSDVHAPHWWMALIGGIIMIGIAIWAARHPGSALNVLVVLLGIWIILWGIVEMVAAFSARHAKRAWEEYKAQMT